MSIFGNYRVLYSLNGKDVSELVYLHILALQILHCEYKYSPIVVRYASYTQTKGFDNISTASTDLGILLNFIFHDNNRQMLKNHESNHYFFKNLRLQPSTINYLLQMYRRDQHNRSTEASLIDKIGMDLRISNSNYRSVGKFASRWDLTVTYDKRLALTRLLQAFRARLNQSPLRTYLETLAREEDLELHNVNNPEYHDVQIDQKPEKKGLGWLGNIAAIGLGAYLGSKLGSRK